MTTVSREEMLALADFIALEANGSGKFTSMRFTHEKWASIANALRLAAKPADDDAREALKPFAKIADDYDRADALRHSRYADEGRPAGPPYPDSHRVSIGLGDCRKARDTLSTKAKP